MNAARTSSVTPLACAERISTRRKPNVIAPPAGREASRSATSEKPMAPASASMWPASESSASELAIKPGVGLATGSLALISAGIESSGDVVAATLTLFAVRLGGRPADPGHPYGHRRAENLGALGESVILLTGGAVVSVEAITRLIEGGRAPSIHWYQFAVIALALVVDVSRTTVNLRAARRYSSPALQSNAFHFAADMAGSLAVLGGLLAVNAGVAQGDAIAALLVAAIFLFAAVRLIAENANVL